MNTMTDALKRAACAAIDAQAQRLTAFGRDILAHPELGYKETRTAGKVLEAFASLGLTDVTRPARTGVKGWLWRGAGPRVAVIGELDAVLSPGHPFADKATGAAHACGHNAQLASMLGCAVGLRAVADSLAGSVCLLAAPAEEYVEIGWRAGLRRAGEVQYLGGKQQLIAEGAFDDIDMAMMVHSETDAPQPRAVVAGAAASLWGAGEQPASPATAAPAAAVAPRPKKARRDKPLALMSVIGSPFLLSAKPSASRLSLGEHRSETVASSRLGIVLPPYRLTKRQVPFICRRGSFSPFRQK